VPAPATAPYFATRSTFIQAGSLPLARNCGTTVCCR